jgi:hypothetical protein
MEVKLMIMLVIIGLIVTGANLLLYFQIEKLIKFLREYKMEKLVSMQNEIQSLEESLALYTFMSMPDKEKEEFIESIKKDMEGKNGR